jgi:methylmalonyl-CoA/ethylmalonyl-CoA epimerase
MTSRRFHHTGFVVAAIEPVIEGFKKSLGLPWDGQIIHDPLQDVWVAFLGPPEGPFIELVAPASSTSPVQKVLTKGGGLHHLCYEVSSLTQTLEESRALGNLLVRAPLPAVAFGGRHIAWVYTRQKLLLEFLEL